MNYFVGLKLIIISICILFVNCLEEVPENNLSDGNTANETELFDITKQNKDLNQIDVTVVADILKETTTTSSTTLSTTITTTTETTTTPLTSIAIPETTVSSINESSTNDQLDECIKVGLNAKISFKYNSNDGNRQEITLTGGNSNGELIQPNKCDRRQKLVVNYEQIAKSQLVLWIIINGTHVYADELRFEYPIEKLPDDYKKPDNLEELELSCSADIKGFNFSPIDKCLVAKSQTKNYLMQYKINDHIKCSELPIVTLETPNKDELIDVLITDFSLIVSKGESDIPFENNDGLCTLISNNSTTPDSQTSTAGQTKVWLGVTFALVGGLLIFGVILLYEKVIRKKFMYRPVKRKEPEIV